MTNNLSSGAGCNEAEAGAIFWRSQTATAMGIETDATANFETGDAVLCREFVDLAFRDIQQLGDIGDGEGAAFPVQRIREARRFPDRFTVHRLFSPAALCLVKAPRKPEARPMQMPRTAYADRLTIHWLQSRFPPRRAV